jgi:hypothetical protein
MKKVNVFRNRGTKTEIIYAVERIIIRVGWELVNFFSQNTTRTSLY